MKLLKRPFMVRPFMLLCTVLLSACGSLVPRAFDLTPAGVKSLDAAIVDVEITSQPDGSASDVDITVSRDPALDGSRDWHGVAVQGHKLFAALLVKPEVSHARIVYISPSYTSFDWAQLAVRRADMPPGWAGLTELQFFSHLDAQAGTVEMGQWLCDFYRQYPAAVPSTGKPAHCKS